MIENKSLMIKKLIEYKKEKDLKEKISKVKPYKLPNIEWFKKDKEKEIYNLIQKSLGWSMKAIGKTRSGKTWFVSAFLELLIDFIDNIENIYLLSPTFNQIGWDRIKKIIKHINDINDIVDINNSIIVCDDMQVQLKGNKVIAEMILNKRHRNLGIIQCGQNTQITDLVQKMNADYFISLGTFTLSDCQYFVKAFLPSISAEVLFKIIKHMNKNNYRFLWIEREENLCLGFVKRLLLIRLSGVDAFLIKNCINV